VRYTNESGSPKGAGVWMPLSNAAEEWGQDQCRGVIAGARSKITRSSRSGSRVKSTGPSVTRTAVSS